MSPEQPFRPVRPEDVRIHVRRIAGFLFLFPLHGGFLTQYTSVFREG